MLKSVLLWSTLGVAICSVAFSLFYRHEVLRWMDLVQPFCSLSKTKIKSLLPACNFLDRGIFGCEGIAIVDDLAFLACSHRRSRQRWYPPLFHLVRTPKPEPDQMYVYDFSKNKLTSLVLANLPAKFDAVWHSLAASKSTSSPGSFIIAAGNYQLSGKSCVEMFLYRPENNALEYQESVCDPLLYGVTGIALFGDSAFYATSAVESYEAVADSWVKMFLLLSMQPTVDGKLIVRNGPGKPVRMLRGSLAHPTDIALDPSKKVIYILEGLIGRVTIYDVSIAKSSSEPIVRIRPSPILLPHSAGRLSVDPATGRIFAAGPLKLSKAWSWRRNGYKATERVSSGVVVITNNTDDKSRFYGRPYNVDPIVVDHSAAKFSMATTAVLHQASGRLLIGGPMMQGLVECRLEK